MTKPIFDMTKKPSRQKMYKVSASYQVEGKFSGQMIERARFLHAGDAYNYAVAIHGRGLETGNLIKVTVERP